MMIHLRRWLKSLCLFDWAPLAVMAALWFTVLVLVPGEVFLSNQSELLIFRDEALLYPALPALVFTLVGAGVVWLLRGEWRQRAVALTLAGATLLWIHGYVLVWRYGIMDGSTIAWEAVRWRALVDGGLWIAGLGLAWWKAPWIHRHASFGAAALLAIQAASLMISSARSYQSPTDFFKNFYVEKSQQFAFSPERNVVVIVLDEYQSDIFSEAITPNPVYARGLDGFTYFPNTVAGFNFTEFAIPAILTGRIYDNQVTRAEFLYEAYLGPSLPTLLQEAGFEVELYPWRGFANESMFYDERVATNFKRRPIPRADRLHDLARLVDLSLFRCLPQFAKPWVHRDSQWLLGPMMQQWLAEGSVATAAGEAMPTPVEVGAHNTLDWDFIRHARFTPAPKVPVTADRERPTFKFYHLAGIHVPVKFNREIEHGEFDYNRPNFSEHAEAYIKVMVAFLAELKKAGIYDQTMIVITGDHGSGRGPDMYVNPGSGEVAARLSPLASRGDFQRDKARGAPLLLVKPFGAHGELERAESPASVVDIPATVLAALELPVPERAVLDRLPEFRSTPVFELEPAAERPRYYGAIRWAEKRSDYVNPISLWKVDGHVWDDAAWSFVEKLSPPPAPAAE